MREIVPPLEYAWELTCLHAGKVQAAHTADGQEQVLLNIATALQQAAAAMTAPDAIIAGIASNLLFLADGVIAKAAEVHEQVIVAECEGETIERLMLSCGGSAP